jgi:NAD(P)-dependent dehydrogenase (short-subunit alcohol dehydrogenase family)
MSQFDASTRTDDVIRGVDLSGKQVVVTGASSGLGVETARCLAGAGADLLLVARDAGKLDAALATLRAAVPGATFDSALLDLADLASVRAAAEDILARCPRIDVLVNNAGVMACPLMRTADGLEMQFGTNHVGHFLLTARLMPALRAAAPSRIVNLSSAGHKFGAMNLDDPNYEQRDYNKWVAYGESKTANVLFTVGLEQRFGKQGVHALAVHPGVIMTELSRHMDEADFELLQSRGGPDGLQLKSVEQGAATSVWAATAAELEGRGGLYLEDCHVAGPAAPGQGDGVEAYATDPALADRLWEITESLVGETFS